MSNGEKKQPPMVTLCKGDNFEVHLVCYPSGVYLEVDAAIAGRPRAMIYSEVMGSIDKISTRLKEGKIG